MREIGQFNQVVVGIPEVDRHQWTRSACPVDRSPDDIHAVLLDEGFGLIDVQGGDEAEIGGTRRGVAGFRLKFPAVFMKIDFLIAEFQGNPTLSEAHDLHSQNSRVELEGFLHVSDGEDQVIDAVDVHFRSLPLSQVAGPLADFEQRGEFHRLRNRQVCRFAVRQPQAMVSVTLRVPSDIVRRTCRPPSPDIPVVLSCLQFFGSSAVRYSAALHTRPSTSSRRRRSQQTRTTRK